jgi:hypothetical protein
MVWSRESIWFMAVLGCCACSHASSSGSKGFDYESDGGSPQSQASSGDDDSGGSGGNSIDAGLVSGDDGGATGTEEDASPARDAHHGNNPCAQVPIVDNGYYCATTTQFGFDPSATDGTSLYKCQDGTVAGTQACPNGCIAAPAGMPDSCM